MTSDQLKAAAIAKLAGRGIQIPAKANFEVISAAIGEATGLPRPYYTRATDFVQAFVSPPVPARTVPVFRPMRMAAHPRLAEIDQDQPPMMTPNGTGNHNQYSEFMLSNGRTR